MNEGDLSEIGVRFGFVLMLGLSAIAAWAGLEAILGAFLAGLLFTYVFRETRVLETKLLALGQGFFVPIFFINVGISFNLGALGDLGSAAKTVAVLALASLSVKLFPTLLLVLAGMSLRVSLAGSFLLATPLTLLVAAALLGFQHLQGVEQVAFGQGGHPAGEGAVAAVLEAVDAHRRVGVGLLHDLVVG